MCSDTLTAHHLETYFHSASVSSNQLCEGTKEKHRTYVRQRNASSIGLRDSQRAHGRPLRAVDVAEKACGCLHGCETGRH